MDVREAILKHLEKIDKEIEETEKSLDFLEREGYHQAFEQRMKLGELKLQKLKYKLALGEDPVLEMLIW